MTSQMEGQIGFFAQDTESLKTYPDYSQATPAKTSERFSRKSQGLSAQMPLMCLCLTAGNGPTQDASSEWVKTESPLAWRGNCTTLNTGESRSDVNGFVSWQISTDYRLPKFYLTLNIGEKPRIPNPTKLSQILVENPDEKYRLSAKACRGILNRAAKRGKELPPELKRALEEQSVSKNEPESLGGGKGLLIQHEHVGALSTLNIQRVCEPCDTVAPALDANYHKGAGERNGVERTVVTQPILLESNQNHATVQTEGVSTTLPASMGMGGGYVPMVTDAPHAVAYGICSYESNAMKSGNPHSGIYKADTTRTIDENGGTPSCNQGGMCIVERKTFALEGNGQRASHKGSGVSREDDPMFTLNGTEYHGVAAVDCRNCVEDPNVNGTLQAKPAGGSSVNLNNVVRTEVACDVYNQTVDGDVAGTVTAAVGGANTSGPKALCIDHVMLLK